MRRKTLAAAVGLIVFATGGAAGAGDESPWPRLMEQKAPTVVMVKAVLKVSFGSGNDRESPMERTGVVVDPDGVVMLPTFDFGSSAKVTPMNLRVLFEGDEKEYDAVLGAMDSKLGLAFLRIKDLGGKKITATNFADGAEAKLGDELFGVLRTDQGFDYAPYFGIARVVGQVTKPRTMWLVTGFIPLANPLYTSEGKVAGVVIRQTGTTDEGSSARICLLPVKSVVGIVAQAVKASAKALEDAKAHEAEAGMGEPAMGDATPTGMGDAPTGMGDGGMAEPGMTEPGMT